jgi:galactokinase
MRKVAAYFGKSHLREVDQNTFFQALPALRLTLNNDRCLVRAVHFFQENSRVERMLAYLAGNDIEAYLSLVRQRGEISFIYLHNLYPRSIPREQGLSLAIAMTKSMLGFSTTVRVHGGGFAGTIQAYVRESDLGRYKHGMEAVFGKGCVTPIAVRSKPTCCIAE